MSYDNFTKQKVFSDELINILCNRIYENIQNNFSVKTNNFCTTGSVAKIIQGQPLVEIPVIAFITDDTEIFKHIATKMAQFLGGTSVALKNRVQIEANNVFVEFWYTNAIGTINTVSTISVQDLADIPTNIK